MFYFLVSLFSAVEGEDYQKVEKKVEEPVGIIAYANVFLSKLPFI